ncbi:parathyroid hormone/parathyroid hormone-related peptide receptor-like protein, partial [Leptotrombidium deliense]
HFSYVSLKTKTILKIELQKLNFLFFINITRVLFLKMFSSSVAQSNRRYKYSKWFKSTLVLVPLFGVHYAFFLLFNSIAQFSDTVEVNCFYCSKFDIRTNLRNKLTLRNL